jgi:hypothetical protein
MICPLNAQISAADAERAALEAKKRNEYATVQPVSSFDEWFAKNGRPQHLHEPQYGYTSFFYLFSCSCMSFILNLCTCLIETDGLRISFRRRRTSITTASMT